jgi:predicted ATPase
LETLIVYPRPSRNSCANQFNRGAAQLIDPDERAHVATIDLSAGRKAKASAAYASARAYFSAGMALLDERDWSKQYELTFSLWLERPRSVLCLPIVSKRSLSGHSIWRTI